MRCVDRAPGRDVIILVSDTDLMETNTEREKLDDFRRIELECSRVPGSEKIQNGPQEVFAGGPLPKHEPAVTWIRCC